MGSNKGDATGSVENEGVLSSDGRMNLSPEELARTAEFLRQHPTHLKLPKEMFADGGRLLPPVTVGALLSGAIISETTMAKVMTKPVGASLKPGRGPVNDAEGLNWLYANPFIGEVARMVADPSDLRSELQREVESAQAALEIEIALLRNGPNVGASLVEAEGQRSGLSSLMKRIGQASDANLSNLRSEVGGALAQTQGLAQQARSGVATAQATDASLHAAHERARRTVSNFVHEFYEQKKLDPYLQFASAKDEDEYRKREAERRAEIEKLLADGSPAATAKALALSKEQLLDAGAHGADRSPDFRRMMSEVDASSDTLAKAEKASAPLQNQALADPLDEIAGSAAPEAKAIAQRLALAGAVTGEAAHGGHGVGERHRPGASLTV